MYALCDGNSFYAACEKVFDPAIRNKPVVVLSNNDGCVIAACDLVKSSGLSHDFKPYFLIKNQLDKLGVVPRSSNYELYADLSHKMMQTCAMFAKDAYVYSVDECFLNFGDAYKVSDTQQWIDIAQSIRKQVWRNIRIPTGVGIGLTPTLAKAANHASKRIDGYRGIAVINDEASRINILRQMSLKNVWGIGKRLALRLEKCGYKNALELSEASPHRIREQFSIVVENTVRELKGEVRLSWGAFRADKKEIYSSRSFGERVTCLDELRLSLTRHGEKVGRKLREQNSLANLVTVFASSSKHDNDMTQYAKNVQIKFERPTNDSLVLSQRISLAADAIFEKGVYFYKSGVGALDLISAANLQSDLFSVSDDKPDLMACYDKINGRFGKGALRVATSGFVQRSEMKRAFLSPQYTTNWQHIPKISCR